MGFSKLPRVFTAVFFLSYPKFPLPNNHHPASMIQYLMSLSLANYFSEVFKWSHVLPLGVSLLTD